jgi:type IV pilus assembly protein PilQ
LRAEFIQVNYARAEDVAGIIRSERATFMSDRGSLTVDSRTNTLLIQDTDAKLEEIRRLVDRLDVPVQQVLIETRIVIATDDFARDLGARFGVSGARQAGRGHHHHRRQPERHRQHGRRRGQQPGRDR